MRMITVSFLEKNGFRKEVEGITAGWYIYQTWEGIVYVYVNDSTHNAVAITCGLWSINAHNLSIEKLIDALRLCGMNNLADSIVM